MPGPPSEIVCVDCGETAHLLNVRGEAPGERIAAYRCSGCMDRWDIVVEPEDDPDPPPAAGPSPPPREGETGPPGAEG